MNVFKQICATFTNSSFETRKIPSCSTITCTPPWSLGLHILFSHQGNCSLFYLLQQLVSKNTNHNTHLLPKEMALSWIYHTLQKNNFQFHFTWHNAHSFFSFLCPFEWYINSQIIIRLAVFCKNAMQKHPSHSVIKIPSKVIQVIYFYKIWNIFSNFLIAFKMVLHLYHY